MPKLTTLFKWPTPLDTDRVIDGEDAMGTLAQAIENTLKATTWVATPSNDFVLGTSVWTATINLACTGATVGSTLLAVGLVSVAAGAGAGTGYGTIDGTGVTSRMTETPGISLAANQQGGIPVFNLLTVTAANPVVTLKANSSSASSTLRKQSHLVVARIG